MKSSRKKSGIGSGRRRGVSKSDGATKALMNAAVGSFDADALQFAKFIELLREMRANFAASAGVVDVEKLCTDSRQYQKISAIVLGFLLRMKHRREGKFFRNVADVFEAGANRDDVRPDIVAMIYAAADEAAWQAGDWRGLDPNEVRMRMRERGLAEPSMLQADTIQRKLKQMGFRTRPRGRV